MDFKFELGQRARDRVTGFEGTIIGRGDHITSCNTYGLQPEAKDGKIDDAKWFDEPRLELVKGAKRVVLTDEEYVKTGPGPNPQPTRTVR